MAYIRTVGPEEAEGIIKEEYDNALITSLAN